MIFSDPTDYRLEKFRLSILWERKALHRLGDSVGGNMPHNALTITWFPRVLTQKVS